MAAQRITSGSYHCMLILPHLKTKIFFLSPSICWLYIYKGEDVNHGNPKELTKNLHISSPSLLFQEKIWQPESNTKNSLHIRSNSWPYVTHPLESQFEEHLNRLKSSESASSSSLSQKLSGLQYLYDCTDKLLQLSVNQEAIARECCEKWVDELLDRSLRLLDICTTAKDCLLQSKESMLELHSIIRRRRSAETGFIIKAGKYLASRKNMKKEIRKALRNFEGMTNKFSAKRENDILSILKVAEAVTVSTLGSLLSFISDTKGQLKQNRWSAISKLIQPKRVACSEESESNEFEMVDAALKSLTSHKLASTENFQVYMGNLEMCVDDLEPGVGIL